MLGRFEDVEKDTVSGIGYYRDFEQSEDILI